MKHYTLLTILITCCLSGTFASAKPHAVIVVGTHHYSPERSMPPSLGFSKSRAFVARYLFRRETPK